MVRTWTAQLLLLPSDYRLIAHVMLFHRAKLVPSAEEGHGSTAVQLDYLLKNIKGFYCRRVYQAEDHNEAVVPNPSQRCT